MVSCSKNKYEKKIIGTWYEQDEIEKLKFVSDSLFVNNGSKIGTWKANKTYIEYNWVDSFSDSIIKTKYPYKLKSSDTIIFTSTTPPYKKYVYIKSNSFIDFLFRKNNVEIDLKKNNNAILNNTQNRYGIKIFVSYKNNKIKTKSEYSESIENLDYDLKMILKETEPFLKKDFENFPSFFEINKISFERWKKAKLYYSIFADKKVPKDSLNKIVKKLKNSKIKKAYQVFYTSNERYFDFNALKMIKL